MNHKITKLIRRFAEARHLQYDVCKKIYQRGSKIDQALYKAEMVSYLKQHEEIKRIVGEGAPVDLTPPVRTVAKFAS